MIYKNDNNLFFVCSLIEYLGRMTKNRRVDVVEALGRERLEKLYELADVYHSDHMDRVSEEFIADSGLTTGSFDNVADCDYAVPNFWDIGRVYARLVECIMVEEGVDIAEAIFSAHHSPVSDLILDFNGLFFCENPDNIFITYATGVVE